MCIARTHMHNMSCPDFQQTWCLATFRLSTKMEWSGMPQVPPFLAVAVIHLLPVSHPISHSAASTAPLRQILTWDGTGDSLHSPGQMIEVWGLNGSKASGTWTEAEGTEQAAGVLTRNWIVRGLTQCISAWNMLWECRELLFSPLTSDLVPLLHSVRV